MHLFLFICSNIISSVLAGPYINVLNDNFQNLDNWVAEDFSGAQSGNNEWEYYTSRSVNVYTTNTANGQALVLHAQKESYNGYNYTSGKVHSKQQWGPYGFFNIKSLVPKGNGLWPAIWMIPTGGINQYGSWAACGEIDIMETVCNSDPGLSTLHFGGPYPANTQYPLNGHNQYPFSIDWTVPHWFGVEWQPTFMKFWFDANIVNGEVQGTPIFNIPSSYWYSQNTQGQKYPGNAPFNLPTNIILNLAIGGFWPCSVPGCCENLNVPVNMYVYNVQVWERT